MKKLMIIALLGSAVAATPAVANGTTSVRSGDWVDLVCSISPLRLICRR